MRESWNDKMPKSPPGTGRGEGLIVVVETRASVVVVTGGTDVVVGVVVIGGLGEALVGVRVELDVENWGKTGKPRRNRGTRTGTLFLLADGCIILLFIVLLWCQRCQVSTKTCEYKEKKYRFKIFRLKEE